MSKTHQPPTRVVYAAFDSHSKLPNKRLTIQRRGPINAQVAGQLSYDENLHLIGVLDSTKTTWIDEKWL